MNRVVVGADRRDLCSVHRRSCAHAAAAESAVFAYDVSLFIVRILPHVTE
jgi:hypothetical protein